MRRREGREEGSDRGKEGRGKKKKGNTRREEVVVSSKLDVFERGKRRGIYSIK